MVTQDGELNYIDSEDDILGHGSCGRFVFRGSFGPDRMPVAVKRIQRLQVNSDSVQKEVELMKKARHHPNILRFIHIETSKDNHFLLIATERCSGTLKDYVENVDREPKFVSEWEMLRQMTTGLEHLHRLGIVHRDIKPKNILISVSEGSSLLLKLADFGISKALHKDREDFTNTSVTNPNGTRGWMAPEVYESKRFDFGVDVWALGLIFIYIRTGGRHPSGNDCNERILGIWSREPTLEIWKHLKKPYSEHDGIFRLVKSMLKREPSERPTIATVKDRLWEIARSLKLFDLEKTEELLTVCRYAAISEDKLTRFHQLVNDPTVDIHGLITNKSTPLHWLCKYCQNDNLKDLVQLLVQKGADVNAKDESGSTPLRYLCENYDIKDIQMGIVQFFIRNIDVKNSNECTELLELLCWKYNNSDLIDIIRLLVENGADISAKHEDGWTPLHSVCRYYHNDNLPEIIQLFLEKNADVNAKTSGGRTPLHLLCRNYRNDNLPDIIQLLLGKDADVNAKDEEGWTPLHLLCRYYQSDYLPDIIQLLSGRDADVDAKDEEGWTPLHLLCRNYRNDNLPEIIQLFLGKDVDVNAKTPYGWTPLHSLCRYYQNENLLDIIQLFLEKDADVNVKNSDGWTPLHFLCLNNKSDNLTCIIQLFIEKGAKVNAKTKDGLTPLHFLCRYFQNDNLIDIVEFFIGKGADVNSKTQDGSTPLLLLCRNYQNDNLPGIIKFFLRKGADVNAKTTDGWTPLHHLCRYYKIGDSRKEEDNLKSMITLLVAKGASMDAKNNDGVTPKDLQIRRKRTALAIGPMNRASALHLHTSTTKDEDSAAQFLARLSIAAEPPIYEIGSASTQR